jgi:4-hydroxy-4-methyl-2-oxoglutarate aldolase
VNDIATELIELGVPTLYEAAGRRGLIDGARLLVGPPFAGPARTASIPAGDNIGVHIGLRDRFERGVFCIASAGQGRYGIIGELLLEQIRVGGWTAVVLDDAVRDIELLEAPPSVVARGVCSRGTIKLRSGPIGEQISLGGILIRPDDWIVGDRDGVMVLPTDRLQAVLDGARLRAEKESRTAVLIRTGLTVMEASAKAAVDLDA